MTETKQACEKLKGWRERAGLSQAALAAEVGISQEYVCQLEGGKKVPALSVGADIERITNGEVTLQDWAQVSKGAA